METEANEMPVKPRHASELADRCADELEAALRQSGVAVLWKPIETAPKDGRPVLATTGHYSVFTTRWEDGEWYDDMQLVRDPVYWMPLPVAPGSESAPPATSGLVEALHGCAKALPVLETMLTVSALHGGAEVTRKLLADVTAALAAVQGVQS